MRRLAGKVAVVAGGATGIGAETSRRLASEGALVVVGDLDAGGAERVAATIRDTGEQAVSAAFDLGDEASVAALIQTAVETFGGVDLLHANAADVSERTTAADTDAVSIDLDVFDHILRTNLRGHLVCCRYAIPKMLERGGGAIVCTSSGGGVTALPRLVGYCAAKAGVISLVQHVAARWGKEGIRCNAVAPGPIQTDTFLRQPEEARALLLERILGPRLGIPADVAACVAYLLSDDAAFVNGQVIQVNGGSRR
jgi:NAD(P)-dependent dehydrogenase (short-subunit alcohol dehydrogenase family)